MYIGSFAVISGEVAILQRRRCFHVDQVVVELACLLEEHFVAYRSRGPSVPGERPKSSEIEESTRSLFPNGKFWISDYHILSFTLTEIMFKTNRKRRGHETRYATSPSRRVCSSR